MKYFFYAILYLGIIFGYNYQHDDQKNRIEVIYKKAYKNFKDISDNNPKYMDGLEYRLLIDGNKSIFHLIPSMSLDKNRRFIGKGGGRGKYYKDLIEKVKLHQIENLFSNKVFLIQNSFTGLNWEITKENKIISGFKCFKAIAFEEYNSPKDGSIQNREVVVWFTPEIHAPFGPAGYDGLPGLVLEKSSGSFYYIASKINFNPDKEHFPLIKPSTGRNITREEYEKQAKTFLSELRKQ